MKAVTKDMIHLYQIKKLGYDFMGYTFVNINELSFHHLIVPKQYSKEAGIGDGYLLWNGAILKQETSHDYLHLIERIDRESFLKITNYMIQENKNGKIDIDTLKRIREILLNFEYYYGDERNKDGKPIIKRKFIQNRIPIDF